MGKKRGQGCNLSADTVRVESWHINTNGSRNVDDITVDLHKAFKMMVFCNNTNFQCVDVQCALQWHFHYDHAIDDVVSIPHCNFSATEIF